MDAKPLHTAACIGEKPDLTHSWSGAFRSMLPRTLSSLASDRYVATARRMQKDAAYAIGVPPYWFIGGPEKKTPIACELKASLICSRERSSCAILIRSTSVSSCELTASTWKAFSPTKKPGRCGTAIISGHLL